MTQTEINVPVDGTITSAKLSGALTTPAALTVTGALTVDTNTLVVDATNNRVGIGTSSPSAKATIQTATNEEDSVLIKQSDGTDVGSLRINNGSFLIKGKSATAPVQLQTHDGNEDIEVDPDGFIKFETAGSETMRITANNVGIGVSAPTRSLVLGKGDSTGVQTQYTNSTTGTALGDGFTVGIDGSENAEFWNFENTNMLFATNGSERARLDSSGNLLVGKDAAAVATVGTFIGGGSNVGLVEITRDNNRPLRINRLSSDGQLVRFDKDSTNVGSIGTINGSLFIASPYASDSGLRFSGSIIHPCTTTGSPRDNAIDLGYSAGRFDDIFATNGTIQTSDRNEKQDIEELSEAEKRVAVAAKGLMRKFRWIDSVESKGDNARIHFGIIAQDLQDAFTAEGLDAARYAMFCSDTWTNDDGSEQTRLGVRYSELLAFIIAAI
jgi:hypothetical protein